MDFFLGPKLKDEVMKIMPVQKVSAAGQITRFKAFVAVGDESGHVGLGVKCAKEVSEGSSCFCFNFCAGGDSSGWVAFHRYACVLLYIVALLAKL